MVHEKRQRKRGLWKNTTYSRSNDKKGGFLRNFFEYILPVQAI